MFRDGEHILYVNGAYRDDSAFGKLMHDFSCSDPDEMFLDFMRDSAKHFKESEEGVQFMCEIFDEVRKEGEARGEARGEAKERAANIRSLMKTMNWTQEEAMAALEIPFGK